MRLTREKRIALFLIGFVLSLLACLFLSGCCTTDIMPTWAWSPECVSAHPGVPFMRRGARAAPSSCLPNPALTPGVADPTVTVEMLRSPEFIKSRRSVSESVKQAVYARYGMAKDKATCPCEVDHLISLELGGDNSVSNLWPQPYTGSWNARMKDRLENYLHREVLAGRMRLPDAQRAISVDWTNAYARAGFKPGSKQALFNPTHAKER